MTRSDVSRIIVFALIAAVAVALFFVSVPSEGRGAFIKFAGEEEILPNTIELSSDGWEKFTYRNAPDFTEPVFDGEDAYYYELDCDKTEEYSVTASLTSPLLEIYDGEYDLGIRYFTRQKENVPNELALFVSADGENFTESDRIKLFDSGAENAAWRNATMKASGGVKYVKFVFKVYYGGAEEEKIENSGLYLCKKFTLTAKASGVYSAEKFSAVIPEGGDALAYNGEEQYPSFDVVADTDMPYYYRYAAEKGGAEIQPVAAGDYVLRVDFFDDANAPITTVRLPYTIVRQTIELRSYEIVSNPGYAVLIDAEFVDGAGREVGLEEVGCDRIYDATAEVNIEVKNPSFEPFAANLGRIEPDAESAYVYYIENKDVTLVYDGEEKDVTDEITVFSHYDFGTGEFTVVSAGLSVEYYLDGIKLESKPKNAGVYDYRVGEGAFGFEGTLTVLPKTIESATYAGAWSLDKVFDGTTATAENGGIVRAIGGLVPAGIIECDEVVLSCAKTLYARETGNTYPLAYGATLGGADAANYVAAEEIYVDARARITPTVLYWTNNSDVGGGSVSVVDKEYDGTTTAEIESNKTTALVMKGLGGGSVTYGDIGAEFDGKDAGERKVIFTLTNEALYDRYAAEITTEKSAVATIFTKKLAVTSAVSENTVKTYDGNAVSEIVVKSVSIAEESYSGIDDGFGAAFATGEYVVAYESAEYDGADSGNRTITVKNAFLKGFTRETEEIFANYSIASLVAEGRIDPAEIEVITEKIRIYNREALPDIETTALNPEIITAKVYATYDDAVNEVNRLPDTTQIAENGDYFLRVESVSDNFVLVGNAIIPLAITPAQDREEQFISVTGFGTATGDTVTVPVGGRVSVRAASVTSDGRKTGLVPSYAVEGAAAEETGNGEYRILRSGAFSVTITCDGNAHYSAAESVTVRFEAADVEVIANASLTGLYVGDALPAEELGATAAFTVNGTAERGKVTAANDDRLLAGTNGYEFFYQAEEKYIETALSFTITDEVYERTAEGYVLTADTSYADGKVYYAITAELLSVAEGDALPETCYERTADGYVRTSDTTSAVGKEYYALTVEEDTTREVKADGYFTYDGTDYVPVPVGGSFLASETYYAYGREFYGEKPINIALSAERREVTVTIGGVAESVYGEKLDPFATVVSLSVGAMKIPVESLDDFDGRISIIRTATTGGTAEEDVTDKIFEPGDYVVYGTDAPEGGYEFRADDEGFVYRLVFAGTVTFRVNKSRITICAPNVDKYYFASPKTEDELRALLTIEGVVVPEDVGALIAATSVASAASREASVGNYAVVPVGETETERYIIGYRRAYVTVLPAGVTVFALSSGHVYGNQPSEIRTGVSVSSGSGAYLAEDIAALKAEIAADVTYYVDVSAESDAGDYPIDVFFLGDATNYELTFGNSVYTVEPAAFTGITFEDMTVLYDGERHSPEITYDKNVWQGLTVRYDKGYFVEAGVYEYTAVVSKKNYKDLTLKATLTIGTLTIASSSVTTDAVTVSVSKDECKNGLSPETYVVLAAFDDEKTENLRAKINENAAEGTTLEIVAAYDVNVLEDGVKITLGYSSYELSLRPAAVKYSEGLKLFGYGEKGYGELEYEYKNGVYYVKCASLEGIAFVKEVKETVSPIYIWIGVAIFALIVLFVLAVVFSGSGKGRKERARSRRRHQRWA